MRLVVVADFLVVVAFVGAVTAPLVAELADLAAEVLGWSAATRAEQIAAITSDLADRHQVELSGTATAAR